LMLAVRRQAIMTDQIEVCSSQFGAGHDASVLSTDPQDVVTGIQGAEWQEVSRSQLDRQVGGARAEERDKDQAVARIKHFNLAGGRLTSLSRREQDHAR
jgi:hypothetical protein